jgi:hypothetical protein
MLKAEKNLLKKINLSTLIIIAVIISSMIYFLSFKQKVKITRLQLQENINTITKEKILLEDELKKANAEKIMLEETSNKLKDKVDGLIKDLDTEKKIREEVSTKLSEKEKETERLNTELTSFKKEKVSLELKIAEAQDKIKMLESSLNQLETVKANLERKLDTIMSKRLEVELEKVVVRPKTPGIARVLAVNNSYEFVVINLGQQHAMEIGKIMGVYRQGELIAKIKIEKTYEVMSVADIIFEASKGIIREEDLVKEISSDIPPSE